MNRRASRDMVSGAIQAMRSIEDEWMYRNNGINGDSGHEDDRDDSDDDDDGSSEDSQRNSAVLFTV